MSLCRHSWNPLHRRDQCDFAHSLCELRPPVEIRHRRGHQWDASSVDRFYGQCMSREQIRRFWYYYHNDPIVTRPVWSHGLFLLERGLEDRRGFAYPWDFGLSMDAELLVTFRNDDGGAPRVPFTWYPDLWERLQQRRIVMGDCYARNHLGRYSLDTRPHVDASSDQELSENGMRSPYHRSSSRTSTPPPSWTDVAAGVSAVPEPESEDGTRSIGSREFPASVSLSSGGYSAPAPEGVPMPTSFPDVGAGA